MRDINEIPFNANCADLIRLFASLWIAYGHTSYALEAPGWDAWQQLNIFHCLILFFALSGFYVSASLERSKSAWDYLKKRLIRVYPALWFAFAVSLVIVYCSLYGKHQVSCLSWGKWILAQISIGQFYVPQELKVYGTGHPNGALWMIPLQLGMYVIFLLTYKLLRTLNVCGWCCWLAVCIAAAVSAPAVILRLPEMMGKLYAFSPLPYAYIFYIAMFIYIYRNKALPLLCRYFWLLLIIYVTYALLNRIFFHIELGIYVDTITCVFLTVLTIACAYKFGRRNLRHDYSYGIYVFHCIFVNMLFCLDLKGHWWSIVLVYLLSLSFAWFSCHFIEEPIFRRLKN